jgi:hypothetical protein
MDVIDITEAFKALDTLEDEDRNSTEDIEMLSHPGFRQIPPSPGFKHGLESMKEAGPEVSNDGVPLSLSCLPAELLGAIVAFLLDTHDFRSAALFNRTCKLIHTATLSTLWMTVFWRWYRRSAAFLESDKWRNMTESEGFKFTKYVMAALIHMAPFS